MKSNIKLIGYINVGALGSDLVCRVLANNEQESPTRGQLKKLKANDNETMSKHNGWCCAVLRGESAVGGGVHQHGAGLYPTPIACSNELEHDVDRRSDRRAGIAGNVEPMVDATERPNLV